MNILMVAAENGALPGGKVGGMGDVIRDVPLAIARLGHQVDVLTPGYQYFSRLPGARQTHQFEVSFRDRKETVALYRIGEAAAGNVIFWALEHPLFACGGTGKIYCSDPPGRPYSSDATKFALFSAATAEAVADGIFDRPDVIHLHDWHTALIAVLAAYDPAYRALSKARLVYSIHNLSYQGIRPFRWDESSLESWFPKLSYSAETISDPRYPDCFNPMRAAINLCRRVHSVSPGYASEIQRPSAPEKGFIGGEGLERDLQMADSEGRLVGILNGCDYSQPIPKASFPQLLKIARREVLKWIAANGQANAALSDALQKLDLWQERPPPELVLTFVGRLASQKVHLFTLPQPDKHSALDRVLDLIGNDAVFLVLGNGDAELEEFFATTAAKRENLIFLCGFSEALSRQLFARGNLFFMPSSYEPCGISQMYAMRAGQPCLAHAVGGLADTIADNKNGFLFRGDSPLKQSRKMIERLAEALELKRKDRKMWSNIRKNAQQARFAWSDTARQYLARLYF